MGNMKKRYEFNFIEMLLAVMGSILLLKGVIGENSQMLEYISLNTTAMKFTAGGILLIAAYFLSRVNYKILNIIQSFLIVVVFNFIFDGGIYTALAIAAAVIFIGILIFIARKQRDLITEKVK